MAIKSVNRDQGRGDHRQQTQELIEFRSPNYADLNTLEYFVWGEAEKFYNNDT